MDWKIGDILVDKEFQTIHEIEESFNFYDGYKVLLLTKVEKSRRHMEPSIHENLLDYFFRKPTDREKFLFYIGVREL